MKAHMNHLKKKDGINKQDIWQSSLKYEDHKVNMLAQGNLLPLGEGVLIWDETKVLRNNSA